MSLKQCSKCIHDEMCKYKEKIEEIKEENIFVEDVTCNRFTNAASVTTETKPTKKATKPKKQEPESEPEATEKTETVNPDDAASDDEIDDFDSLKISNLFLSEPTVKVLNKNGINTVADIYTLNNSPEFKWSSVKGLKEHQYNELNNKMTAFNKPQLVDYN